MVFAVIGLYMYYPAEDDLFEDIGKLRVELYYAVREGDPEETRRRVAQWKMRVEKLPTSVLIRAGTVTESQRESVDEVLYGLRTLQETLDRGQTQQAKTLIKYVDKLHNDCRGQFRAPR